MCLSDLIGIRSDCDTTAPLSGLYINDLAGMSLDFADATHDQEYQDGVDLIQKKIQLTEEIVKNEVQTHFADKVYQHSIIENGILGHFKKDLEKKSKETGHYVGVRIDLDKSAYTKLYIRSVKLFLKAAITTDVKIWDAMTGKELVSKSVTTVADEPTEVIFDEEIETDRQETIVFIGYESTADSNETGIETDCKSCRNKHYSNEVISAFQKKIPTGSTILPTNLESLGHTGGVSVDYSVYCSLDNFVCKHKKLLALPLMYRVAHELAVEAMNSSRLNSYILIDDNEAMADMYMSKYDKAMKNVLGRMQVPRDTCFRCRPKVRKQTEL